MASRMENLSSKKDQEAAKMKMEMMKNFGTPPKG
jgi:hypothetical protein